MVPVAISLPKIQAGVSRAMAQAKPDTCSILRNTPVSDGAGGSTAGWATIASAVACRISRAGRMPIERLIVEELGAVASWKVALPAGQDIRNGDHIVTATQTLIVTAHLTASFEVEREVLAKEVAP